MAKRSICKASVIDFKISIFSYYLVSHSDSLRLCKCYNTRHGDCSFVTYLIVACLGCPVALLYRTIPLSVMKINVPVWSRQNGSMKTWIISYVTPAKKTSVALKKLQSHYLSLQCLKMLTWNMSTKHAFLCPLIAFN